MFTLDITVYDTESTDKLQESGCIHNASIITNGEFQYCLRKVLPDIPKVSQNRRIIDTRDLKLKPKFQGYQAESTLVGKNLFLHYLGLPTTRLEDQIISVVVLEALHPILRHLSFELGGKTYHSLTYASPEVFADYVKLNSASLSHLLSDESLSLVLDVTNNLVIFSVESDTEKWLETLTVTYKFIYS